jgi:aryl-alcohol dehydrogenase-like predicted oxidoreductase
MKQRNLGINVPGLTEIGFGASAIVGARTLQQVEENTGAPGLALDATDIREIEETLEKNFPR